jgi:hypothetical protein
MSKDIQGPLALPLLAEPDHQRVVAGSRRLTLAGPVGRRLSPRA